MVRGDPQKAEFGRMRVLGFVLGILLGIAFGCRLALAQLDTVWTARLSSTGGPFLYDAVELADGSFVVAGITSPNASPLDAYAARVSSSGEVLWTRSYGHSDSSEQISALAQLPDGNMLAVGHRNGRSVWLMGISSQGDSLWSRFYYGVPQTRGQEVEVLAEGNVIIAGIRLSATGHSEAWILKCRPNGDTLWTRTYGSGNLSVAVRIRERDDRTILVSGHMIREGSSERDVWLLLLNPDGSSIWSRTFGTAAQEFLYGDFGTFDNQYFCGRTQDRFGFAACAGYNGDSVWFRTLAYDDGWSNQQLRGMTVRQSRSVLAVGWAGPSSTSENLWVQTVSGDGELQWSWLCPWYSQSRAYGIIPVVDSGCLIYGVATIEGQSQGLLIRVPPPSGLQGIVRSRSDQQPVPDVFVSTLENPRRNRTDEFGRYHLDLTPGSYTIVLNGPCIAPDTVTDIEVQADTVTIQDFTVGLPSLVCDRTSLNLRARNHLITADSFMIYNGGTGVMNVVIATRTDAPPTPWLSAIPASISLAPEASQVVTVVVAADTTDDGPHDYYGALLLHSNSCPDTLVRLPVVVTVLGTNSSERLLPAWPVLHAAYPNPFNSTTILSFDLPRQDDVRLTIYNLTGRAVARVADATYSAGYHRLLFDASNLPSGVYICRMKANENVQQIKLFLLR